MGHVTSPRTASHRLGALGAAGLLLLAACTGTDDPASDGTGAPAPGTDAAQTGAADDITEGRDWGERVVDEETGYLVKQEGQWAGVLMQEEHGAVFQVVRIVPDLECTQDPEATPESGRFLGLEIEVETSPRMEQLGTAQFPLAPQDFQVRLADGGLTGGLTGAGENCLPPEERLDEDVPPGVHQTGMVVLDAPADAEAVVLDGARYRMTGGWLWHLGEDTGAGR